MRLLTLLAAFRDFLEKTLFAAPLEAVIALETGDALENFAEGQGAAGDFAAFLRVAREVRLDQLGRGPGAADVERRLSWTERPPISQRSL
jgi:hydrogenase large subunit